MKLLKDKYLILTAQVISMLFSPFYFPVIAFVALFLFSYIKLLPLQYKLVILVIVYLFTVVVPRLGIYAYRRINGWSRHQLSKRERRSIPYILSITSYSCLLYLLYSIKMPRFTLGIIIGALLLQIICALLNSFLKMSTHSAAAGAVVGALLAFSLIFQFDPTYWLCFSILLAGAVGTSRLILRQHTLEQIGLSTLLGFLVGFACMFIV